MSDCIIPHPSKVPPTGCVSLIGMAASGKTTIARILASLTGWAHVDTDHVLEAYYGVSLQTLSDALGKEAFLDVESVVIRGLHMRRAILSTGGSVVYRQESMDYLAGLGPLVHLDTPLPIILRRIARKPDRGLAIAPGQTVEDLFAERQTLYARAAAVTFAGGDDPPQTLALRIAHWLAEA